MFAAMHARNNTIIHNEFSNLVRDSCDPGKKRHFCNAIYIQNASFYRDMLGTNKGKALKKE
eukprot:COSAG06_NODE_5325_length_3555_cov_16.312211_3_plen_61_part_00